MEILSCIMSNHNSAEQTLIQSEYFRWFLSGQGFHIFEQTAKKKFRIRKIESSVLSYVVKTRHGHC